MIYFIPPEVLLGDLERAMSKVRLEYTVLRRENGWLIAGASGSNRVRIELSYTLEDVFKESRAIGEIPVSTVSCYVEGDEDFVERFKRALEISLLRCLG